MLPALREHGAGQVEGGRERSGTSMATRTARPPAPVSSLHASSPELIGGLKLGNVWLFAQLLLGPHWPMNQLIKNPNVA